MVAVAIFIPGVNSVVLSAVSSAVAAAVVSSTLIRLALTRCRLILILAWEKLSFATVTLAPRPLTIALSL